MKRVMCFCLLLVSFAATANVWEVSFLTDTLGQYPFFVERGAGGVYRVVEYTFKGQGRVFPCNTQEDIFIATEGKPYLFIGNTVRELTPLNLGYYTLIGQTQVTKSHSLNLEKYVDVAYNVSYRLIYTNHLGYGVLFNLVIKQDDYDKMILENSINLNKKIKIVLYKDVSLFWEIQYEGQTYPMENLMLF